MNISYERLMAKLVSLKKQISKTKFEANKTPLIIAAIGAVSAFLIAPLLLSKEKTPKFTEYAAGEERKEAFFSHFLPLIQEQNEELLSLREDVLKLSDEREKLSFFGKRKALNLAERYEIEDFTFEDSESWNLLVRRIDIVPPSLALAQAAKESAWGTSRFAREGNNFYGHWCFEEGCGIVPAERNDGAVHEVAGFDSAQESVEKYMHNLNYHPAYKELRSIREGLRKQDQPITGLKVAEGLDSYSERGEVYIDELSSLIRYNNLDQYDSKQSTVY